MAEPKFLFFIPVRSGVWLLGYLHLVLGIAIVIKSIERYTRSQNANLVCIFDIIISLLFTLYSGLAIIGGLKRKADLLRIYSKISFVSCVCWLILIIVFMTQFTINLPLMSHCADRLVLIVASLYFELVVRSAYIDIENEIRNAGALHAGRGF